MRPDDFFAEETSSDGWTTSAFNREVAEAVIKGDLAGVSDVEMAEATLGLLQSELENFANGGTNRVSDDHDIELVIRAGRMACKRAGVDFPGLPFRNLSTWSAYWRREGLTGGGSWAARRERLDELFSPARAAIEGLQLRALDDSLAYAVSPWGRTGWRAVDVEIQGLRARFETARSSQDYSAVGIACVRVLESIGEAAFNPLIHLKNGESYLPRDKTKERLGRVIEGALSGADAEDLRRVVNATVSLAHRVKHRSTPTRRDAGMAADAAILLANLVRRAVEN
jgi:hypothetical protein